MRKSRLLLVLPFAPLVGAACFSPGSGGNGPNTSFDSGIAEFDGTADAEPMDGSPVEAAADVGLEAAPIVDASTDVLVEAGPQPITVVVVGNSGPESGISVVWGDATGAVVGNAVQTTNGTATTLLPNVTMATVLIGTPGNPSLYTAMGLQPGNTVYFADTSSSSTPTVNVTALPPSPPFDAGVFDQSLTIGGCNQYFPNGLPYTLPLNGFGHPCIGLQAMGSSFVPALPSLVQAYDANFDVLGFAYVSQPLLSLMSDDVGLLDYSITGSWSTATTQQLVDVTQPADASFPTNVTYSEIFDGLLTPTLQRSPPADAGANASTVATTHVGIAQAVQLEGLVFTGGMGDENIAVVSQSAPPSASGTVTLDTSPATTVPGITNLTVTGTTQPVFGWTIASGDLHQATGIVASMSWYVMLDGGSFGSGSWTLVSPGTTASSLTAPQLPASLAAYAPAAGANTQPDQIAVLYGQTAMPSYASFLPIASFIQQGPCNLSAPVMPPMTGPGTAMLLVIQSGDGC